MVSINGVLAILLTAGTMGLIYALLYSAFDSALLFAGEFRDKKEVLGITLAEFLLGTLISIQVHNIWKDLLSSVSLIQPTGLVLILGMFVTNEKVTNWKHTDNFSLGVYTLGLILLIAPFLRTYLGL